MEQKLLSGSSRKLHLEHVSRAYELERLQRYELALQEVERALELDPRSAEAHTCGAWILRQSGRLDNAEEAVGMALGFDPMLPAAHNVQACILWSQGRLLEAEQAFESAIALQGPDTPLYLTNYARMELARQHPQDALKLADRALALAPSRSIAHEVRGEALRVLGQTNEAAAALRAALRLNPRNARAHNSLGLAQLALGHAAEAQDAFREALRLQPGDRKAQANLVSALRAQYLLYGRLLAFTMRANTSRGRTYFLSVSIIAFALVLPAPFALGAIYGFDRNMTWDVMNLWMLLTFSVFAGWLLLMVSGLLLQPLFNLLLRLDGRNQDVVQFEAADAAGVGMLLAAVLSLLSYGVLLIVAGPFATSSLLALQTGVAGLIAVLLSGAMRGLNPIAPGRRRLVWAGWGSYGVLVGCLYMMAAGSALFRLADMAWVVLLFVGSLGVYLGVWVVRAMEARGVPASGRRALGRLLFMEAYFACAGLAIGLAWGLEPLDAVFAGIAAAFVGLGVTGNCILVLRGTSFYKRWVAAKGEVRVRERIYLVAAGAFACLAVITLAIRYFRAR